VSAQIRRLRRLVAVLAVLAAPLLAIPAQADREGDELYGAYVMGIKEQLEAHGYEVGPMNQALDPVTARAILQYQHDAGLPLDGAASPELLNHLMFAQPQIRNTRPPSGASLVAQVQAHLAERGYYTGFVDGKAGPRTREAIRQFQADAGLTVTGEADRALLDHLATKDPGLRID